jgi:hypothetical protein
MEKSSRGLTRSTKGALASAPFVLRREEGEEVSGLFSRDVSRPGLFRVGYSALPPR